MRLRWDITIKFISRHLPSKLALKAFEFRYWLIDTIFTIFWLNCDHSIINDRMDQSCWVKLPTNHMSLALFSHAPARFQSGVFVSSDSHRAVSNNALNYLNSP